MASLFFFILEDVAAERWIEKDKGHGVQAVNNPHGYSKYCPHTDVLTEKSLVLIPYSTTADKEKTIWCWFICTEYLKVGETEENEALGLYWSWAGLTRAVLKVCSPHDCPAQDRGSHCAASAPRQLPCACTQSQ